ncbi:type VII secretion target [Nocardioides sp.]|uniref:type VII secretion target n=1 Tax=Nocardioides sp. TaxID=35761 RepID=UPI002BEE4152|nr:type VII secretion target [Nocardioides sp.]HXH77504.1 type VII secretion target [Nocardioides sp.]
MSLHVYLGALITSAQGWEDTSETIRGANKSLTDVDVNLLGDRVAGAAQGFIDTWASEINRLQTTTRDHGDALRETALLYEQADTDAIERSQQLMVWTDRDVSPSSVP